MVSYVANFKSSSYELLVPKSNRSLFVGYVTGSLNTFQTVHIQADVHFKEQKESEWVHVWGGN